MVPILSVGAFLLTKNSGSHWIAESLHAVANETAVSGIFGREEHLAR